MCLAIPGRIIEISDQPDEIFRVARVSFSGIIKKVNLSLVPEARVDDYVLVHVGVAIGIVDTEEAHKVFSYLREMGELNELDDGNSEPQNK